MASTDIADVALRKIVDHPTCGHRMAVIVTFRTKHPLRNLTILEFKKGKMV